MEEGKQKALQWFHTGFVQFLFRIKYDGINCWISSEFLLILLPTTTLVVLILLHVISNWLLMLMSTWKEENMLVPCDYPGLQSATRCTTYHQQHRTAVWKQICCLKSIFYHLCSFHMRCTDNLFLTCSTSEVPILFSCCLFMPIKCQIRKFGSYLQGFLSICNLYWFQLES